MIFCFDSLGAPVSFTPERVFQGSNLANDIYLIAPMSPLCIASIKFALPTGDAYGPEVMEPCDQLPGDIKNSEGETLGVWHYLIPSAVTAYPGAVAVQFTITAADGGVFATPAEEILVERGVLSEEPEQGDSYQTVLNYLSSLNGKVNNLETDMQTVMSANMENGMGMGAVQQKTAVDGQLTFEGGQADGVLTAAFGCDTEATADYTFTAGRGTVAVTECQTAVGKYNAEEDDELFSVGNGTAEQRKTAFSVKTDGRATVAGTAAEDNDVTNKAYVDNAVSNAVTIASATEAGIVSADGNKGIEVLSDGWLSTVCADEEDIDDQTDTYKPITPSNISYAVKAGLGNAKTSVTWTDAEKLKARKTIQATCLYEHFVIASTAGLNYFLAIVTDSKEVININASLGAGLHIKGTVYSCAKCMAAFYPDSRMNVGYTLLMGNPTLQGNVYTLAYFKAGSVEDSIDLSSVVNVTDTVTAVYGD